MGRPNKNELYQTVKQLKCDSNSNFTNNNGECTVAPSILEEARRIVESSERLKLLREKSRYTQAELAEKLGEKLIAMKKKTDTDDYSVSTGQIRNYEFGRTAISNDVAEALASIFNVTPYYVLGIAEGPTWDDYERECSAAENEAEAEYYAEFKRKQQALKEFFLLFCGYDYSENTSAVNDFAEFLGEVVPPPICLKSIKDNKAVEYRFTKEEFEKMLSNVRQYVDFECYRRMSRNA